MHARAQTHTHTHNELNRYFILCIYSIVYIKAFHFRKIFRDRAPMVQRTLLNLLRLLLLLLGTEHRWCEDPIESAPFIIIRDRAPMVRGPY